MTCARGAWNLPSTHGWLWIRIFLFLFVMAMVTLLLLLIVHVIGTIASVRALSIVIRLLKLTLSGSFLPRCLHIFGRPTA
jgi:hypothetical protein